MVTNRRAAEDIQYMKSVAKKTQTTQRKIVLTKPNAKSCQENHPAFSRTCNIYKRERNHGGEI